MWGFITWLTTRQHRSSETHTNSHCADASHLTTRLNSRSWTCMSKVTLPGNHLSLRNSFNYGLCSLSSNLLPLFNPLSTHVHTLSHTIVYTQPPIPSSVPTKDALALGYSCPQLKNCDAVLTQTIFYDYFKKC